MRLALGALLVCVALSGCGVVQVLVRVPLAIATLGISEAIIADQREKAALASYSEYLAGEVAAGRIDTVQAQQLYWMAANNNALNQQSRNQVLGAIWGAAAKSSH